MCSSHLWEHECFIYYWKGLKPLLRVPASRCVQLRQWHCLSRRKDSRSCRYTCVAKRALHSPTCTFEHGCHQTCPCDATHFLFKLIDHKLHVRDDTCSILGRSKSINWPLTHLDRVDCRLCLGIDHNNLSGRCAHCDHIATHTANSDDILATRERNAGQLLPCMSVIL